MHRRQPDSRQTDAEPCALRRGHELHRPVVQFGDLAHDALGHLGARAGELQGREEVAAPAERHVPDLVQRAPAHQHVARLAAQPAADFQAAYDAFCAQVDAGMQTSIDPYAAEAPEEFFAVLSEYHFSAPALLAEAMPTVAVHLTRFYGPSPLL